MNVRHIVLGSFVALALGCAPDPVIEASGSEWPEANELFHQDPRWLGADDAYSVDLGAGRVLWLFGDSFIATSDAHVRSESRMVRNSIAVQSGYDPTNASMQFFWKGTLLDPASFFSEDGDTWYWPGDGERIGDRLVIFLMAVRGASGGLGFEVFGSEVIIVDNPDDDPSAWVTTKMPLEPNDRNVIMGSGTVLAQESFVYAFGAQETASHDVSLARFSLPADGLPDFDEPTWVGEGFEDGQTEFTVHHDAARNVWIEVQNRDFGPSELAMRTASSLEGPWSGLSDFYHPPESDRSDTLVYAAKAHPELQGADLVVTYASNSTDFATLVADTSLYFPRFVKVALSKP